MNLVSIRLALLGLGAFRLHDLRQGVAVAEIPSVVVDEVNTSVWVSVQEVTASGDLHLELLPTSTQGRIQKQLESARLEKQALGRVQNLNSCSFLTLASHTGKPPSRPLESPQDLASTAETMVYGKVTDVQQGFYHGGESTVLEFTVDEYIKIPSELDPVQKLFLVYPWAEMQISGEVLCFRGERGDSPPGIGSTVLLALERSVDFSESPFFSPRDHELFFMQSDGGVSASEGYPKVKIPFEVFLESMREAGGGL